MSFTLPKLAYSYDALEPYIDAETMKVHHDKHHQGYTDKLNAALVGKDDLVQKSAEELLIQLESVPDDIRDAVRNSGGGYVNHNSFWEIMTPDGGGEPDGDLADDLDKSFGDGDGFKNKFSEAAAGIFGSGWVWLVRNSGGKMEIMTTANQDTPLSEGATPLLMLDVWEHAYYLKYQNRRPDYVEAWWNVVNWDKVEKVYSEAR